jgi:AAA+ superfamily predicted ATPase
MRNHPLFLNLGLVLSIAYILAAIVYTLAGYPFRFAVLLATVIPIAFLYVRIQNAKTFVDKQIADVIGDPAEFTVFSRSLPGYRFADIHISASKIADSLSATRLETQHNEALNSVLNAEFYSEMNRIVKPAEHQARQIGPDLEKFFATDNFWLVPNLLSTTVGVIRVRTLDYTNEVSIEIAAKDPSDAETVIKKILDNASANSIYKNKVIEVSFQPEVRDEYGGVEIRERVDPQFLSQPPVTEDDIIVDDDTAEILNRTVIDFHLRRDQLRALGLPSRRGVLFYGPPGTGKTFTSRYLANKLETATTIVASGNALLQIRSLCNLARMLQPAIVVLEDVDLVYSNREINFNNTALGEMMNELDGFKPDDEIIFILTTNSIERVENAIKERPGRISQCIYFGAPLPELRKRYLASLLNTYDLSELDLDKVVNKTDGATQAFLKELVFRTIQIASESGSVRHAGSLKLTNDVFDLALNEMRKSAGSAGESIIGFQIKRNQQV